jgi:hypothetical protein
MFVFSKFQQISSDPRTLLVSSHTTARSESRCALRLRYINLVFSIEVAVEVCYCFSVFSY